MTTNQPKEQSSDPRFSGIYDDPKFRNVKAKGFKVKLDDRFSKKDLEIKRKAKVDKYGRKLKNVENNKDTKDFDKYFEQTNEEEGSEEDDSKARVAKVDRARGEVPSDYVSSSDEFTSSDSEISGESDLESEGEAEIELEETKPSSGDPSKTLAVVNLDWDNVRSPDLMITFASFLPSGGKINRIAIYPSEFGKQRMEREEVEGPPKEIFQKSKKKHTKDEDDSDVDVRSLYEEGDADKDVDKRALRQYQLERLRYYYAIVYCNDIETAQNIYTNCDGTEYESTANIFDIRYVPDGMEFDDEPKDECNILPTNYKPLNFSTDALQHSNVKLTWDETPSDRVDIAKRAFSQKEIDDMDFKAYLASDSDESDDMNEDAKNKLKLLAGGSSAFDGRKNQKGDKDSDNSEIDMEITFTPGLEGSQPKDLDEEQDETSIEKVRRKEKERRKARKQKLKELKLKSEQDKKSKLKSLKGKKQHNETELDSKSKAEMELLMMDDEVDTENSINKNAHFNMTEILKSEKEKSKRTKYQDKRKIVEDDFKPNLNDPRFNEVFEGHDFAIDPTQPEFKGTKAMKEILKERTKRAHKKPTNKRRLSTPDASGKEISNIVSKLKKREKKSKFRSG